MLHYIIQVVAFQLLFLVVYDLFLRKETFFNLNRVYLLSTSVLSLVIPFIKIDRIKEVVAKDFVISLPEVLIGDSTKVASTIDPVIAMEAGINLQPEPVSIWNIILISGMCISTLFLIYKIITLLLLVSNNPKRWSGKVLIICLLNSTKAFSFFNYIFLGNRLTPKESTSILEHEMVHIKQKHSLDLLFFELLRIVFWFNPLVYIYQYRIATLHEFLADAKAVKGQNKAEYYDNLLTQVFETQQFSFVNPFFKHSLIKKRILMLSKSRSNQINLIKYALFIPIVFVMLMYTSSYAQEKSSSSSSSSPSSEIGNQYTQELTDEELFNKYFNEIDELDKSGVSFDEIYKAYESNSENYIINRIEHFRSSALFKYIFSLDKKNSHAEEKMKKKYKELMVRFGKFAPYNDYLDYKKTEKAKLSWEGNIQNGILRLVVDDIGNMTNEENRKFNKKLEFSKKDPFYTGVLVMSSNGISQMTVDGHNPAVKKIITLTDDIEIVEVEEIVINDSLAEIPFSIVEETPTFIFCEGLKTNAERKQCMSENISTHVNKNFTTNLADSLGLVGRQRINVIFKIDRQGDVIDIIARAPHPALEEEARRVIKTLPQFIPGKQKGMAVVVPYNLPIVFQVQGDKIYSDHSKKVDQTIENVKQQLKEANSYEMNYVGIPFGEVDQVPMYDACLGLTSNQDQMKCVSKEINIFVNKNFNTDLATKLGLKGRQRIAVMFEINTKGDILNSKARAAHSELEIEAKRVIESLPQFTPGKHKGELATVLYSSQIQFQVQTNFKENKKN